MTSFESLETVAKKGYFIEEFMLPALLHLISGSFFPFLPFPRVFSCSDSMESKS